jgi:hypothetical protein
MLYIAVVYTKHSGRPNKDLAAFVSPEKQVAVSLALKARDEWERKSFGPYEIFVGELTEKVTTTQKFELQKLRGAL